jgi:hypothetical protein
MIHHISIPARDPANVARVLAELTQSRIFRFPGPLPGAFMVVKGDEHGTLIEVYPDSVEMLPGDNDEPVQLAPVHEARPHAAFHALVSTALDRSEIEAIARHEGWRSRIFGRGPRDKAPLFHVVEVWIENRILIEFANEAMLDAYCRAVDGGVLDAMGLALEPAA